jgi:hypothetical protein
MYGKTENQLVYDEMPKYCGKFIIPMPEVKIVKNSKELAGIDGII